MLVKQKNSQKAIILSVLLAIIGIFPQRAWSQATWEGTYAQAKASYEASEINTALQFGNEALSQAKAEFGYNSMHYAKTLRLLTLISFAGENYGSGVAYNQDELLILELMGNQETVEYANALSNMAMLYYTQDSISMAQSYYENALELFNEQLETLPKGYALTAYNLANIYIETGNINQADSLYQKLLQVYRQEQLQDRYYAGSLYNKAMLAGINRSASQQMLEEAVRVFWQEKATNHPEYANALYQLATNKWQQQNYQVADSLFHALIRWYENAADTLNTYYASALNNAGMIAQAEGNAGKATSLLQRAYDNRNWIYEKNSPEYLTSLNNLAKIYLQTGHSEKADSLYQKLLSSDSLQMPWQVAMLWENWAMVDSENGKFLQANQKLKKAQSIYDERLYDEKNEESMVETRYASTLYYLAQNFQTLGQFDSARVYYSRALNLNEKISGKNDATYASALAGLAALYQDMGKFADAQSAYEEALSILSRISGEDTNAYASMLNNYALLFQEMGVFQQAETLFRRALLIKRSILGNEHAEYMAALSNLGLLYVKTGEYLLAAPLLGKALNFYRTQYQDHPAEAATSLINLAELKQATGKYTEAEPLLKEAISLRREIYGTEHPAYANAINGLALFYQTMGNYAATEPLLIEAREIFKNRYGTLHPDYAALTQNLASLYQITEKPEAAEALLIECIDIDKKILGEHHPDYAAVLSNLASHYNSLGEYNKAQPLLSEALEVNKETFGLQHPTYASTLYNLAALYSDMNLLDTAEVLFQHVVDIRETILGKNHPDYAQALFGLAVLYQKKGDYEEAYSFYREVIDKYTQQVRDYFPALSEKEKSAFYRRIEPVIEAYKSFVLEFVQRSDISGSNALLKDSIIAELYDTQLITKALLLDASSKVRKEILSSGDEDLRRLYENWTMKKEYLVKLYAKSPEELQKENIDIQVLEQRANEIEKELSVRSSLFSRSIDYQQPSWMEVRRALSDDEVAIELVRIRHKVKNDSIRYAALMIAPDFSFPKLVILPEGEEMENKVFNYYRNSVRYRLEDTLSCGYYWAPISKLLPSQTNTIYLSPDGIYNKINLQVLFNHETNVYVLDRYAIRLLSSTRDLLPEKKTAESTVGRAYLFGYPDYNLGHAYSPQAADSTLKVEELEGTPFTEQISMLPGTRLEVNNLHKLLQNHQWNAKKYLGKAAREEKVKTVRNPNLLHIATHGFFLSDLEVDEEKEQKAYGIHLDNIKANPLLRSGLLFAGASNTIKGYAQAPSEVISTLESGDGILTAYEVMNMDLDGTDLVVLSACETGLGEIKNGEGVYGLQRAFLIAGAKSIIMSLWKVDDAATRRLMELFYERWVTGMDKYSAFTEALRTFKEEFQEPYYWGGFVMVGK